MDTFGARIKQERQRLGLNQEEFAEAGGVKRRAQISYEQDERHPDAGYLQSVAALGVDVQYLLTGTPAGNTLAADESELLAAYRRLDEKNKARLLGLAEGMEAAAKPNGR